jgi:hypothetical protein
MRLGQQREAVVGEPLDEPQLPHRTCAIERLREDPAAQQLELLVAARAGKRRVAHVEGDVEMGVVDPHRAALTERHERQPLPIARDQVQAREDVLDQLVVCRGASFEDRGTGDMHVGGAVLEMQKRAVEAGQAVGIRRHREVSVEFAL